MANNKLGRATPFHECPSSTETNPERFAPWIEELPGAYLFSDQWLTSPRTVLSVDHYADDNFDRDLLEECQAAFGYHYVPRDYMRLWVSVVPLVVAQAMEHLCVRSTVHFEILDQSSDPHATLPLPSLDALESNEVTPLVARCLIAQEGTWLQGALDAADTIACLAQEHRIAWRDVVELIDDTSNIDVEQIDALLGVAYANTAA